jgi:alpha-tubulin suppressor-like RCC1 family protein
MALIFSVVHDNSTGGLNFGNGNLWAWGRNNGDSFNATTGMLGDGTTTNRVSPVQIGNDNDWEAITAVSYNSRGIRDGKLYRWGENITSPTQVGSDTDWKSLYSGVGSTFAIKSNGELWGWGTNSEGQLGDGTTTSRTSPVQIGNDSNWKHVAGGQYHTHAVKNNGELWAWGRNNVGQLGDGTTTNRPSPVRIGNDNDWDYVYSGKNFSNNTIAMKGGELYISGRNQWGYFGDGTGSNTNQPLLGFTRIGSETNWQQVSIGWRHVLAIRNGQLWAWGYNGDYQLGDGTTTARLSPVRIGNDNNWERVYAGISHSFAIKNEGELWGWGSWALNRTLGDGTATNTTTASPTRVGNDRDWKKVALGLYHTLAIKG